MMRTKLAKAVFMAVAGIAVAGNAFAAPTNVLTSQTIDGSAVNQVINLQHGTSGLNTAGNMAWADGGSNVTNGNLWGMNVAYADLNITNSGTYRINVLSDLMHPGFTIWSAGANAVGTWNANHVFGQTSNATELMPNASAGRTFSYFAHANPGAAFTTGNAGSGVWSVAGQTIGAAGENSGDTTIGNGAPEMTSLSVFFNAGHYLLAVGGACPTGVCADVGAKGFKAVSANVSAVPVPGAVWLFGSAMLGLMGFGRRKAVV